jgi:putative phage-type endonuclease
MMTDIIQGTEEWHLHRLGRVTASRVADVLATLKTGEAASRRNYRMELVCQRLTGQREEGYTNSHMERGIELEPIARSLYEFKKGVTVEEVGFIDHPSIEMSGASPDGIVGDGLIEIKCPTPGNHVEVLLSGKAPTKYIPQMQWQMACTGAKWCDFVSYCPLVGDNLALFVVRVERDDIYIAETENVVKLFLTEVADLTKQLKELS